MSNDEADFESLIQELAKGSEDAARELSTKYAPRMLEEIRKYMAPKMRSKFDSTDFLQDVWASFFAAPKDKRVFARREDLMAFLKSMAKNKVIDGVRHENTQKRNITLEQSIDDSKAFDKNSLTGKQATPSQILMKQEAWKEFLKNQPLAYRPIFMLAREGKTQVEIAAALGLHPRTVSRAMNRLNTESAR